MIRSIHPAGAVHGLVHVPGSKSITNRALICAALARGTSRITGASDSDDTLRMVNGLNQLGVLVRREGKDFVVEGNGGRVFAPRHPIPVGNAGTTFRFLTAVACLADGVTTFAPDSRMMERPMEELFGPLRRLGAVIEVRGASVTVRGGSLRGGPVAVSPDRSSQFLSALLLVAPCLPEPLEIRSVTQPASGGYVAMTLDVMKAFGGEMEQRGGVWTGPASGYRDGEFCVEADASGAAFFFAAAAITAGTVEVPGVFRRSLQPDAGFPGLLMRMGCQAGETGTGTRVTGPATLQGIDADMHAMPDAVPALTVTALFAATPSRIRNVPHLRHKESDRLAGLAGELSRTGARVEASDDGLTIHPAPLHGVVLDTLDDHRLAMSFALLGLRVPGIAVENPGCVVKSFPSFWEEFAGLTESSRHSG